MHRDVSLARHDSFSACKQRCMELLVQRYSSLSLGDEQRRLRIHLRRLLLEHDDGDVDEDNGALGRRRRSPSSIDIARWRQQATQRIAARERRQRSATVIQQWWRLRRRERATDRGRDETELPSSSRFVPVTSRAPQQHQRPRIASSSVSDPETTTPPSSPSHTHAIVVELLGARDLLQSASDHPATNGFVSATLQLVRESDAQELGRVSAERVPYQDAVSWEQLELRVSLSSASMSPSDILRQTSVHVELVRHRSAGVSSSSLLQDDATPLGRLTIALDLLETPLAERYAMTRWFPLERRQRVGPARGEVRLTVRFLARHAVTRAWVAFAGSSASSTSPNASTTPGTSFSTATIAPSASKKPPLSPRRRQAPSLSSPSKRLARRQRPLDDVRRPEAMSPPSSPSSYSSVDNNDRESDGAWSPRRMPSPSVSPERPRVNASGIVSPKAQARARPLSVPNAASGSASSTAPAAGSPDDQKKPFLKRKPYQVVFRKLDWSRVGAKTDSNWGRATTAKLSPKNIKRETTPSPSTAMTATGNAIDTLHAQRLEALTSAVHAVCRVSEQSKAALALMKYRAERKTYLHSAAPAGLQPSYLSSEDALQSLWRRLHSDDDGSVYAAMLQELPSVAMSSGPS